MSAFWGSRDKPLPGWKKNKKAWEWEKGWEGELENPKKKPFQVELWVQFIKDNFEDGGTSGPGWSPKFFRLQRTAPRNLKAGDHDCRSWKPGPPYRGGGVGRRAVEMAQHLLFCKL